MTHATRFSVLIAASLLFSAAPRAEAPCLIDAVKNATDLLTQITSPSALDLSSWHVGDRMDYNISLGGFFPGGTLSKTMSKDEGTSLWIHQDIVMQGQNQTVDTQIDKATGKILKMIQNGQEQPVPTDKIQIISQDSAEVTVPAGTFKSIHIVAKSEKIKKIEVWMNPHDTVMDGTLKQDATTDFGIDMVIELTKFSHG